MSERDKSEWVSGAVEIEIEAVKGRCVSGKRRRRKRGIDIDLRERERERDRKKEKEKVKREREKESVRERGRDRRDRKGERNTDKFLLIPRPAEHDAARVGIERRHHIDLVLAAGAGGLFARQR